MFNVVVLQPQRVLIFSLPFFVVLLFSWLRFTFDGGLAGWHYWCGLFVWLTLMWIVLIWLCVPLSAWVNFHCFMMLLFFFKLKYFSSFIFASAASLLFIYVYVRFAWLMWADFRIYPSVIVLWENTALRWTESCIDQKTFILAHSAFVQKIQMALTSQRSTQSSAPLIALSRNCSPNWLLIVNIQL